MIQMILRRTGAFLLLALLLSPAALRAQNAEISVVGSGIVAPLIEALNTDLSVNITGTDNGFTAFCNGEADITTATRPISIEEDAACAQSGIEYQELIAGHAAVAIITNPDDSPAQCLTAFQLNTLLQPSAQGQITDWNQVNSSLAEQTLSLALPTDDTISYAIIDALITGDGLRRDATVQGDADAIIEYVSETAGAIGIVDLVSANNAAESVKILNFDGDKGTGCVAPSAENIENRTYEAANRLFVYINSAQSDNEAVEALTSAIIGEDAAEIAESLNFTALSENAVARNTDIIENKATGRQFSKDITAFNIPTDIFGTVNVGGNSAGFRYISGASSAFSAQYPSVTTEMQLDGEPAGFRRLCNGEIDLAFAHNVISDEQLQNCAANNITPLTLPLGARAAVLVANADTDYLECLTTEQITATWQVSAQDTVTTWDQVDASFPSDQVLLIAPPQGTPTADLLLSAAPIRLDAAETNNDPLYRAAAVANAEGALTFMSWQEYNLVLNNQQDNIQIVSVDAGEGCVAPSEETLLNGEYPLSAQISLVVNPREFSRPEVQSFVWYLYSDSNYGLISSAGIAPINFDDLPEQRDLLQAAFDEAENAAPEEVAPEADAEGDVEAETEGDSEEADTTEEATEETEETDAE